MKNPIIFIFLTGFLSFLAFNTTNAQNFGYETMERPWSAELGIGPGWMYADNVGSLRGVGFSISPVGSIALSKRLTAPLSIRGTLGVQGLRGNLDTDMERRVELGEEGNAYDFIGQAYYFDVAPVFRLFRTRELVHRSKFNIYASAGIGGMGIVSTNNIMIDGESVRRDNNMIIPYIPVRAGISYRFRPLWDLALEGSVLLTFSDEIDGHAGGNRFDDHLMNVQVKVRKFFTFRMIHPLLGNPAY
jgi:hypothetical protein